MCILTVIVIHTEKQHNEQFSIRFEDLNQLHQRAISSTLILLFHSDYELLTHSIFIFSIFRFIFSSLSLYLTCTDTRAVSFMYFIFGFVKFYVDLDHVSGVIFYVNKKPIDEENFH